jgi:hypothetical protein
MQFQEIGGRCGGGGGGGGSGRFGQDTLEHITKLSRAGRVFMSDMNVDVLQDAIRFRVWVESGGEHVIGRQTEAELSLVMRSILLQFGRNDDSGDIAAQVRELNARVLEFCVPRILREVDGYMQYRRDASRTYMPMRYGDAVSNKAVGSRTLEGRDFI